MGIGPPKSKLGAPGPPNFDITHAHLQSYHDIPFTIEPCGTVLVVLNFNPTHSTVFKIV